MVDGRRGDGPPDGRPAIGLSGLTKRYRRGKDWLTAVNGVTLSVPPGQVIGLLGPNGAGKTTTIKMIASLVLPTAGIPLRSVSQAQPDLEEIFLQLIRPGSGDGRAADGRAVIADAERVR